MAVDEVHDGPFCVIYAVDSKRQKRLAYEVLQHSATQEDVRRFFQRIDQILRRRSLSVEGITTDGSPLYPERVREIWPNATHQLCQFHVLQELVKVVLGSCAKVRRTMARQLQPLPGGWRGQERSGPKARRVHRQRRRINEVFRHRHLLVRRHLSSSERQTLRRLSRYHRRIGDLRELMDEVYALFDRRCRTDTARAKLHRLRRRLSGFKNELWPVVTKILSPHLEKALMFLDNDLLEPTSNSVERANRRHRKMQKSIYRVRTHRAITGRIALDFERDRLLPERETTLAQLHQARALSVGAAGF